MIPRNRIDVDRVKAVRTRFESKYERKDGVSCWPWTAGTFPDGYGRFTLDGEYYQAHRIAWVIAYEEDPSDALILHQCYNEACVNPAHLTRGTQRLNMIHAFADQGSEVFSSLGEENPNSKLSSEEAREIRERYENEDVTQTDLADEYNVSATTISNVIRGVLWSHA